MFLLDAAAWRSCIGPKSKSLKLDRSLYLKIEVSISKVEVSGRRNYIIVLLLLPPDSGRITRKADLVWRKFGSRSRVSRITIEGRITS